MQRCKLRTAQGLALALALLHPASGPTAGAAEPVTAEEAHAIGVEAYLYFYPLVTMDLTRKQLTNVERPTGGGYSAQMNTFANVGEYPTADMKVVVRPNFDTLYSSAWLDLTKEPVIVSVPDTDGRYYLLPMLDMWTNVFASPGWRTTGTQAGDFAILPPGWRPEGTELPDGVQRIDAPTFHVWIIGRIKTDGPKDYDAVHKIQAGLKITPLSGWGKPPQPVEGKVDPGVDMKTPPKIQVDRMAAGEYFAYAAEIMELQPPHITDQPILARMARIGIERGQSFDLAKVDPTIRQALESAPKDAQQLMAWKVPTLARVVNEWSMNTDTMGVYGNYYLKRAIVAQLGLGANLPQDAIYPLNLGDEHGRPLDGTSDYAIHFEGAELPPVDAFWSITLYDQQGYQVANNLDRFAVSSWMPLERNPDGSLDLYFQSESPAPTRKRTGCRRRRGPSISPCVFMRRRATR
jgi:hypothetical protein